MADLGQTDDHTTQALRPPHRRRWWLVLVPMLVGAGALASAVAWRHHADTARADTADRWLRLAQRSSDDVRRATLMRVAAYDLHPSAQTRLGLVTALLESSTALESVALDPKKPAVMAEATRDSIVAVSASGHVGVFDRRTKQATGTLELRARPTAIRTLGNEPRVAIGTTTGSTTIVNVDSTGRPTPGLVLPPDRAGAGSPIVGLAMPWGTAQLIAVHANGTVEFRSTASTATVRPTKSLRSLVAALDWDATTPLDVGAVEIEGGSSAPGMPELPATVATSHGIARVDLATMQGRELAGGDALTGEATSIIYAPCDDLEALVGTTEGLVTIDDAGSATTIRNDGPVRVSGSGGSSAWVAAGTRSAQLNLDERCDIGAFRQASTPATTWSQATAADTTASYVTVDRQGDVVLRSTIDGTPFRADAPGSTTAVGLGSDGEILTTSDTDFDSTTERLLLAKLGERGKGRDGDDAPNRLIRSYRPARDWSTSEESPTAGYINSLAVSDRYVMSAGRDDSGTAAVLVWDRKTGRGLRRLTLTAGPAEVAEKTRAGVTRNVMDLRGADRIGVYSTLQESLVGWDPRTWEQVYTRDIGVAHTIAPDAAGKRIVATVAVDDQQADEQHSELLVVDAERGEIMKRRAIDHLMGAAFSPDGERIATVLSNGKVEIRDASTFEVESSFLIDDGNTRDLVWSHDGELIAVVRSDEEVILADPATGTVTPAMPSASPITASVQFSADDRYLVARQLDRGANDQLEPADAAIWNIANLRRRTCDLVTRDITAEERSAWLGDESEALTVCPKRSARAATATPEAATSPAASAFPAAYVSADPDTSELELVGIAIDGTTAPLGTMDFGQSVRWSPQGTLAWTSEQQLNIRTPGGTLSTIPCGCAGVEFDGETAVTVGGSGAELLRFDPGDATASSTTRLRGLPTNGVRLIGTDGQGRFLVGGYATPQDRSTPEVLTVVDREGTARRIDAELAGQVYRPAPRPAPEVLIGATASSGACASPTSLYRVRLADQRVRSVPWPTDEWGLWSYLAGADGVHHLLANKQTPDGTCLDPPVFGSFTEQDGVVTSENAHAVVVDGLGTLTQRVAEGENAGDRVLSLTRDGKERELSAHVTELFVR